MVWLLRASLALNGLLGLALSRRLRHRAMVRAGVITPLDNDFAAIAEQTFVPCGPGTIALVGDSHVAIGPWLELLTPYRNRGISGAKIADVGKWIDDVLAGKPDQLMLVIGGNDVYFGVPRKDSVEAARALFDRIAERAGCPVTVVSIPPIPVEKKAVDALNAALSKLAAERGFHWVDIGPTLEVMDWTIDGIHLTPEAYRAVAPELAAALERARN